MDQVIEVEGEQFRVDRRTAPEGRQSVDFTWLNGPQGGTYGFTVGTTGPATGFSDEVIEQQARGFVQSFFAPDGIGPADFPDFIAERGRTT